MSLFYYYIIVISTLLMQTANFVFLLKKSLTV